MRKTYIFSTLFLFVVSLALIVGDGCKGKSGQRVETEFQFKEKLSDYGFFKGELQKLIPGEGVVSYELSTPLFTDYAVKKRFIVLPKGTAMKYTANGALDFPDSTIIIKNFAYTNTEHQNVMIETRLLAKDPKDKKWKVMNYLWNAQQTLSLIHI
nr:hypothetical protein [Pedobacter sp. ASV19]